MKTSAPIIGKVIIKELNVSEDDGGLDGGAVTSGIVKIRMVGY